VVQFTISTQVLQELYAFQIALDCLANFHRIRSVHALVLQYGYVVLCIHPDCIAHYIEKIEKCLSIGFVAHIAFRKDRQDQLRIGLPCVVLDEFLDGRMKAFHGVTEIRPINSIFGARSSSSLQAATRDAELPATLSKCEAHRSIGELAEECARAPNTLKRRASAVCRGPVNPRTSSTQNHYASSVRGPTEPRQTRGSIDVSMCSVL
jgi:hypothetical protein